MLGKCTFCTHTDTSVNFMKTFRLFAVPYEMASLGTCGRCGAIYVRYSLDYRDDSLDYYFQVSEVEADSLRKLSGNTDISKDIREMIRNRDIFFKTSWRQEWISGWKVLVDPRPL